MGEEWDTLRRGGPNGFFIVILAFSWWVEAMDGRVGDAELRDALDDVIWVVRCMDDVPAMPDQLIGGKRAQEETHNEERRNRRRR
jgi:hypothetical protein